MSKPPKVDSMKETIRREKGGARRTPSVPSSGSGARGGNPAQPPLPVDPKSGAPYVEPGLAGTAKRGKRNRGY